MANALIISDYINRNNYKRFTVIVDWGCSSAAFYLLMDLKCEVIVHDYAYAILHVLNYALNYNELLGNPSFSSFEKNRLDKENAELLEEFNLSGFTSEESKLFSSGQDVILDGPRMRLFLGATKSLRNNK